MVLIVCIKNLNFLKLFLQAITCSGLARPHLCVSLVTISSSSGATLYSMHSPRLCNLYEHSRLGVWFRPQSQVRVRLPCGTSTVTRKGRPSHHHSLYKLSPNCLLCAALPTSCSLYRKEQPSTPLRAALHTVMSSPPYRYEQPSLP